MSEISSDPPWSLLVVPLTHACPDSEKVDLNWDFSFLMTYFHYERLHISNRIPLEMKYTLNCYLYPCLAHTQCEVLNAHLPKWYIFSTNDFGFLIEYHFKWNIPITVIYTHVWPIPSAKCLMHTCPDSKKIDPNRDFFWTIHFHYEWLQISNWLPLQMKHTNYCYFYWCPTHTQCKELNAHLARFRKNWSKSRFFFGW